MFCVVTSVIKDPSDRPIPGAIVYFALDKGSYTIDAQYPSGTIRIEANAQGEISADLWIDSTGLVPTNWVVRLPSGGNWRFSIPANTTTATLESLLRLGMAPPLPGAIDAAIAIHNADPLAHPGLGGGGGGGGLIPIATATDTVAASGGLYVATSASILSIALPPIAIDGAAFGFINKGSTVRITQAAGQQIVVGDQTTTIGVTGRVTSFVYGDWVEFLYSGSLWWTSIKSGYLEVI